MFGFFKKKKVEIIQTGNGSHGDHWGAVLGFETLNKNRQCVIDIINSSYQNATPQTFGNNKAYVKKEDSIGFCVISNKSNKIVTSYPCLFTSNTIPFKSFKIQEWKHVDCIEAQIEGKCRDTFGIKYFAIDYYRNSELYKNETSYNVNLTGFAYVIEELQSMPQNFSDDFVGYMPSQKISAIDTYDFIGKIVEFEEVSIENLHGFIFNVKLINDARQDDFFNLNMFVNKENMRFSAPQIGMKITGFFWLQGCINLLNT